MQYGLVSVTLWSGEIGSPFALPIMNVPGGMRAMSAGHAFLATADAAGGAGSAAGGVDVGTTAAGAEDGTATGLADCALADAGSTCLVCLPESRAPAGTLDEAPGFETPAS
jgi:hypothetical protein